MNTLIKQHPYLYIEQLLERVEKLEQQIQDLEDRKANKRGRTQKDSVVSQLPKKR